MSITVEASTASSRAVDETRVAGSYSYQRLSEDRNEIRLLQLHPGAPEDSIRCTLQPVHLSSLDSRDFETVSYCWGDTEESSIILVDNAPLNIPTSAEQALRRFRDTEAVRTLWIDSVCINQNDLEERAQQVELMSRIYSSGTRNLIWLGADDGTMQVTIHALDGVMKHIRQATNDLETFPASSGRDVYWEMHSLSGIPSNIDPMPILRLCTKPWFSRLWVCYSTHCSSTSHNGRNG